MGKAEFELAMLRQQTNARLALVDAQLSMMHQHFERRLKIMQLEQQVRAKKEEVARS